MAKRIKKNCETKGKLVMYRSVGETLVCDLRDEAYLIREWFGEGAGRSVDHYYRCVFTGVLTIVTRLSATPESIGSIIEESKY